jgi:hypothetical protein
MVHVLNFGVMMNGFLGKLKNVIPFCLLDDKHPEAEHVCLLSIYSARDNTKIKTQSRYSYSFLPFYKPFLG